jgi:hypothetical protein
MRFLTLAAVLAALATFAIARADDQKPADQKPTEQKGTEQKSDEPKAAGKAMTCKSGEDQRKLEIQSREGGGCKVAYTSGGATKTVGEAEHELEFCDKLVEKIVKKLEAAGFECG